MGVLSALNNAVSGVAAQSYALENISGNIANSSTTAYKRSDTSFSDLVSGEDSEGDTSGSSVTASTRATVSLSGDVEDAEVDTYMALDDDDTFFQVTTGIDGEEATYYTRRGDFDTDEDGYLVNGAGYYLEGYAIDADGTVSNDLTTIQIDEDTSAASATTTVTYSVNLPTEPTTTNSTENSDTENSDVFTPEDGDYTTVSADEEDTFLDNSIDGGTVTVYDSQGTATSLQLRWAKVGDDEWACYYQSNSDATDSDTAWTQIPSTTSTPAVVTGETAGSFTFTDTGELQVTQSDGTTSTADSTSITLETLTVDDTTLSNVTIDLSATQYAEEDGTATTSLEQDGYPTGTFESMSIDDDGTVSYSYSNGQTKDVWQIQLVTFDNPEGLKALDGGAYAQTTESGSPSETDGGVTSSALESSNVDISTEFTQLIVTQQAYSANSKVISTANEMLDDIMNLIR